MLYLVIVLIKLLNLNSISFLRTGPHAIQLNHNGMMSVIEMVIFVSPAKHSDTYESLSVVCLSVRPSVRLSVCLSVRLSHPQSYVSQATHAFLGMLPLYYCHWTHSESNPYPSSVQPSAMILLKRTKDQSHSDTQIWYI